MNINFDMDGTLANLYGVDGWLDALRSSDATPYRVAKPMLNLSALARQIHRLQRLGHTFTIISWLSMDSTPEYDTDVTMAKMEWLHVHLPSVEWDEIHIVEYGVPKSQIESGILFDDNAEVRADWGEGAYDATEILEILRSIRE